MNSEYGHLFLSIAPILSIQQISGAIKNSEACVVGVSPIVGGKAIKGPTDRIMTSMKLDTSAFGVAKYYEHFINHLIIDSVDEMERQRIEQLGVKATATSTIMSSVDDSIQLAKAVMGADEP